MIRRSLTLVLLLLLTASSIQVFSFPPPPTIPSPTFTPPPWFIPTILIKELRATADATLSSYYPSQNFGSNAKLDVGRKEISLPPPASPIKVKLEAVLDFDLYEGIPPGSEITNAQLILTVKDSPGTGLNVEVHPLTKSFTESTVTWSSHSSSYGSTIVSKYISFDAHDGTKIVFDVTPYIKNKVATGGSFYGFLLKVPSTTDDVVSFYSREGAPYDSWKPTLKVSYKSSYIDVVASQTSLNLTQGEGAYVQLSIGGTFNGEAEITHKWVGSSPSGVNLQFSKTSGKVPFASTLQIQTSDSTSPGQYKLEVKVKNKEGS